MIIQSTTKDQLKTYTIFMYHSPQCQYETTPFENIKPDETKAFAKLLLKPSNERDKSDYKKAKFTPYHMDSLPSLTSSNLSTVKQHTNRSRLKALRFLSKPIPKKTRSFYVINMSAPSVCCIRHQRLLLQICTLLLLLLQICKFV
uniref:Uncharacterized protein n=1 Tax=Trichobilharzia regenti TaxID=157069 RepID=A0AA85INN9_TRIRE|nr:unnamed protein product [Trichobilharzia regenti]